MERQTEKQKEQKDTNRKNKKTKEGGTREKRGTIVLK